MAQVDIERLQELVREGYLTCRPHPTGKLVIWNYTPKTMYSGYWTTETRMCRGLITTPEGEIRARPFPKFFNLGEQPDQVIPDEPFIVSEKIDGSLGILYQIFGEEPAIATRGSFTSEQAQRATQILREKYSDEWFHADYTYLFEIVIPSNRIVVDYGDMEDLVLLAMIHTETGVEQYFSCADLLYTGAFPVAKYYDGIEDIAELEKLEETNKEGFVIRFQSGLRLKVKMEEYKRLHRIITQTSSKTIWEMLKSGYSLKELHDRVPPEFSTWVKSVSRKLSEDYQRIYKETHRIYKEITEQTSIPLFIPVGPSISIKQLITLSDALQKWIQRQFSEYPEYEYFLLFLYSHRGKQAKVEFREAIWKSLEPAYGRPFYSDGQEDEFEEEETFEEQEYEKGVLV